MVKDTRNCPWCGDVAELTEQKMLSPSSMKQAYVCRKCKRRHLVVQHEKTLRLEAEILRLEEIEKRADRGEKMTDIAQDMGISVSRIGQILGGY